MKILISRMAFIVLCVLCVSRIEAQPEKSFSDTVDVLHYSIHLNVLNIQGKHIDGHTVLTVAPKLNNVIKLSLDLLALVVDSVKSGTDMLAFQQAGEKLNIDLLQPINMGDTTDITVYYGGQPVMDNSGWGGFYFGTDNTSAFNLGVGFDAIPHNYGRVWFPCIDEFVDRATYDCYIRVNAQSMAVCGGTLQNVTDNGDSTKTYHWYLSSPVPTYLASVAVGRYAVVTDVYQGIESNIPVEIYVRPQDTAKVAGTFTHLKTALQIFENHFGPYRWQRVGYVGVYFNSGSMEHATSIAYPNACITGNTGYDDLMAHELSHHWFGDLITCNDAGDMWINEGWASFCEFVFFENLYGNAYVRDYIRSIHKQVLQMAHVVDGSYLPLHNIPIDRTYCRTVYDKGSLVTNNLRMYLGDSLFFGAVTAFLNANNFKDVSTVQLRDFLASYAQKDLTDFFNNWYYTGGFPDFSIDSMPVTNMGNGNYAVDVYLKQKLNGRSQYAQQELVELTFFNQVWGAYNDTMTISGVSGHKTFNLNFNPIKALVNFNEKSCFATTSYTHLIKQNGLLSFPETHFQTNVSQVTDSVLIRVSHHWVAPDSLKVSNPDIVRLSGYRYWSVEGLNISGLKATGKFYYNRTTPVTTSMASNGWLDNTLFSSSADSLLLLHRLNAADDWKIQTFTRTGNNTTGYLIADTLKEGEYTLAIGKPVNASLNENIKEEPPIKIHITPNPSKDIFNIHFNKDFEGQLNISDINGKQVFNTLIEKGTTSFTWNPKDFAGGIYIVNLHANDEMMASERIMYLR